MTIVVNKELKFISRVHIDSRANQNCIMKGLIPTKYFEKTAKRLYGASGRKFNIQSKTFRSSCV